MAWLANTVCSLWLSLHFWSDEIYILTRKKARLWQWTALVTGILALDTRRWSGWTPFRRHSIQFNLLMFRSDMVLHAALDSELVTTVDTLKRQFSCVNSFMNLWNSQKKTTMQWFGVRWSRSLTMLLTSPCRLYMPVMSGLKYVLFCKSKTMVGFNWVVR